MLVVDHVHTDRYVTFGVPSADAVAISAGTTPSKHDAMSDSVRRSLATSLTRSSPSARAGAGRGPGRLVEDAVDGHDAGHEARGHQPPDELLGRAVGLVDGGDAAGAEGVEADAFLGGGRLDAAGRGP